MDGYEETPPAIAAALDESVPVAEDFLPSPEYFAGMFQKEKISLNVDRHAVESFRSYAKEHGLKYQTLMNQVLSAYAQRLS